MTREKLKPLVVALTGGVASGKTAVSDRFAELGVPIVDTDVIAREVVAAGSGGLAAIERAFGAEMITADGTLDRAALRRKIFEEPGARTRLEDILHPRIAEEARRQLAELQAPYAVLVVPLLVESGLFSDADRVLVIDVPEALQIERLMQRDGNTRQQAEAMLAAQASREQRLARADDTIENTGTLAELNARVDELDRMYRELGTN
ncbi:MAG TPA: dephospho-CoA kinase [Wenzhouxiangellaceae bacterium]|nr:dephospho-CoA kinase [Wenzhouxiangellaceae bacterium]